MNDASPAEVAKRDALLRQVGKWLQEQDIDLCPICNNHIFREGSHPEACPFTPYIPEVR